MNRLRTLLSGNETESAHPEYIECKHCGRAFDERPERCPDCGRTEFATYTFA